MRIGIATPTLVEGDAVGNDVMGMYISLKRAGYDVFLFAQYSAVQLLVNSLNHIPNMDLDIYIYHHSNRCDIGVKFFKSLNCRKFLKYHNITPPHFFLSSDPIFSQVTYALEQLKEILDVPCEILVDSEFNGQDLCRIKQCDYKIVPPYNQVDMLLNQPPNLPAVHIYDDWNTNILMVGRVAANKDILEAIESYSKYYLYNKQSRLIIVGDGSNNEYTAKVKNRISELGLIRNVIATGKVDIDILKAYYLVSDLLLITSKHEGFCVPMVEAMALNLPVLANNHCALPSTGGDAVHYANNSNDIAAGIINVLESKTYYIDKGRKLFKEKYQNASIESLLFGIINSKEAK